MKKQILIFLLVFSVAGLYGQEHKNHSLGGHVSYGKANYPIYKQNYTNSSKYSGKDYFTLAFDYTQRTSENAEFITGLSATLVKTDFISEHYWVGTSATYSDTFGFFSVPAGIRYHFGKYFYVIVGVCFNYHPYKGYTWGLGGFGGLGAEYSFKSGLFLSITPQVQSNMLDLSNFDEKLTLIGCNAGVGYRF